MGLISLFEHSFKLTESTSLELIFFTRVLHITAISVSFVFYSLLFHLHDLNAKVSNKGLPLVNPQFLAFKVTELNAHIRFRISINSK